MKSQILNTQLTDKQIGIFYLGQTGFLIKYQNQYFVIDAYLSDYVDTHCSNELVNWNRSYPAPINPEELDFVDYVFCTHGHYDHADPITLSSIAKVNPKAKFFVPAPEVDNVASYGIDKEKITPMHHEETLTLSDTTKVTAIKSAHEEFHIDPSGNFCELGYRFQLNNTHIFHAGDGCPYKGLEESLKGCDILMLPINGRDYYRTQILDIIGCFHCNEAITIAKEMQADFLIPTHYDLYDVNCVSPDTFVKEVMTINPKQKFHLFVPGERYIYEK